MKLVLTLQKVEFVFKRNFIEQILIFSVNFLSGEHVFVLYSNSNKPAKLELCLFRDSILIQLIQLISDLSNLVQEQDDRRNT